MKELALQTYLRTHSLATLEKTYGIRTRRHGQFENLVCLKYSQFESPMDELVVQQCRGIILDEADGWSVVSYPFDKFFNYGEPYAAALDWESARVQDKLDGSLMTLYFYGRHWQVQSSGTPDASGEVTGYAFSFAELFWRTWEQVGYRLPIGHEDYCFMFELETPYNRVVVQHSGHAVTLHGVRNVRTCEEASPDVWADRLGWHSVKSYPLGTVDALIDQAEQLDPFEQEGFVVCDRFFNRVKLKSSEYVKLSHLKEGSSDRRLLSIVINNESAEFLAYFQELETRFREIEARYDRLVKKLESEYEKYSAIAHQKEFAMAVKKLPYSGVLFALRAGKVRSVRDYLASLPIVKVEQLLEEMV
ncbi:MAG: RNA ligase [Cyanobacteria bacterium J06606_4]